MMKTETILSFIGLGDDDELVENEPDNRQLFEAEMTEIFKELAIEHSDTDKFRSMAQNLDTVTSAYHNYERALAEKHKAEVEQRAVAEKRWIKVWDVAPKVVGLVGSIWLTGTMFLVEQNHPVAVRMINKVNDYLTRS